MSFSCEFEGEVYQVPFGIWIRYRGGRFLKALARVIAWPFEWCGILLGILVLSNLPYRAMLAFCDFASFVYYAFDRAGRRTAVKNLGVMFPGRTVRSAVIRRSYRNMCRSIGYAFWTFRSAKRRCPRAGEFSPAVASFLTDNRPAVTVSAHIGCWEILSQLAFLHGHSMMSVAKDIGTSGMTRMLMRARRSIGQEIVPAEGAFKPLMAGIRSGRSLGLLVDQVVAPSSGGTKVEFFGRDYYVSPAPAFFAAKAHAPIIIVWSRPCRDGRYVCELIDTVTADEARDIRGTTQRIATDFERVIRRHPSAWILNYDYFRRVLSVEEEEVVKQAFIKFLRGGIK